jgi:serine/threonine protein kinase
VQFSKNYSGVLKEMEIQNGMYKNLGAFKEQFKAKNFPYYHRQIIRVEAAGLVDVKTGENRRFGASDRRGEKPGEGKLQVFIVMTDQGLPISKFFKDSVENLHPEDVYELAIRMIDLIEAVHNMGYIYNNLRPDNLVLEPNCKLTKEPGCFKNKSLNLVDLGKVTPYKDFKTGKHLK